MNRVMRGTVVFAAALGVISCGSDPTGDLRNGIDHLVATPSAVFVKADSTRNVDIVAVDEQGNALGTSFSLGAVGSGISVVADDSFNLVYDKNGHLVPPKNWTRARYNVTATAPNASATFVVTAGGKSITVPVRIIPDTAAALTLAVSSNTPNLGDTVTVTAPAGFLFTPASTISVSGAAIVNLGPSADSTQIKFIPGPSGNGPVVATGLVVAYAPSISGYDASSAAALVTPAVTDFAATLSSATANTFPVQDTITLTADPGFKILPGAIVTTGTDTALVTSIAADSSAISFVPVPGSGTGPVNIDGIALSFLTSVSLSLPSQPTLAVGPGGGDAFGTAPTLAIPGTGITATYYDAGPFVTGPAVCSNSLGGPCRIYKFTVAASTSISFSASWSNTTDLGIYFSTTGSNVVVTTGCDGHGNGAAGQPESCTGTFPAGTYYVIVDSFAPFYAAPDDVDPYSFTLSITGN